MPMSPTTEDLESLKAQIRKAVEEAEPEQIKKLLASVIDEIVVESRA